MRATLLLLMLVWPTVAAAGTVRLDVSTDRVLLGRHLEVLEDPTRALTIGDVSRGAAAERFIASQAEIPNFGMTGSAYWVRFEVEAADPAQPFWWLVFDLGLLEVVDLYLLRPEGGFEHRVGGLGAEATGNDWPHRASAFRLELPQERPTAVFIRAVTRSTMMFDMSLWRPEAYVVHEGSVKALFGIAIGISLCLVLYHLLLFATLRDRLYLHYVLFLTAFGLYQLSVSGVAVRYLWPGSREWAIQAPLFFAGCVGLFTLQFSRAFLEIPRLAPRVNRAVEGLTLLALLVIAASFTGTLVANAFASLVTTVIIGTAVAISIYAWSRGHESAAYFLGAWSLFILAGALFLGAINGVLPVNVFTIYGLNAGFAAGGVMLAYALGLRIRAQRQLLERKARHAERLESLDRLAGGVAHRFNNILTSVIGQIELARGKLPDDAPAREHLAYAEGASQSAAELSLEMLRYTGEGFPEFDKVRLPELIAKLVPEFSAELPPSVSLRTEVPPHLPPLRADARQIEQVLRSLVVNACEAIGAKSGAITIEAAVRELDHAFLSKTYPDPDLPSGRYLCIEVCDSGAGIDPEHISRIVDPFFSTRFTGRGLGLSVVLGTARIHKGGVHFESAPGEGTTVTVLFPLNS
jgi:signal transduction histidine kinase